MPGLRKTLGRSGKGLSDKGEYFFAVALAQFSSPSRVFGKGKETAD